MNGMKSSISKLFKLAGNYKILIILSCVLSAISFVLSLFPFICIWFAIRDIFNVFPQIEQVTDISKYGWMAVCFAVTSLIMYFFATVCSHLVAFRVEKNIKKESLHKIVDLPLGFFIKNPSGKLRKIIDDNASLTHDFLAHQLSDLCGVLIMPIAIIIILFYFDWRLGFICLIPLLISILFLKQMISYVNTKYMKNYMDALEDMNSSAVEYIRSIPVVKVFRQTIYSFKNFNKSIQEYSKYASDYALNCRIPMVNFGIAINLPSLLIVPVAAIFIKSSDNYKNFLLDCIFYMLFCPLCTNMMNKIIYVVNNAMLAKEALERIDEILEAEPLGGGTNYNQLNNRNIQFQDVIFSYPESEKIAINHVNITIKEGCSYALIGPSGQGKTTLVNLIARFWDVDQGSISIGGVDVRDFKEEDLMNQIIFVAQNSHLFKNTIMENIRIGNPKASHDQILKAIHEAQCDDIIEKMPNGVNTIIGSEGVYLSGGEQQRIVLARAILKNAPIVILDEATSFADPENEYQIQKALKNLMRDKTVIMITHRLSSIENFDYILVMSGGQIIEEGNHQGLLKNRGVYEKMWREYQTSISWKVGKKVLHD